MKKILIVGGGIRQVQLLEAAKALGYTVVLCDMTTECQGYKFADIYHPASTMDYEALLDVAKKEKVDGIITNSEPAMPIVTRIANELGLVGNIEDGINILMSKSRFRDLQRQVGVYCPAHFVTTSLDEVYQRLPELTYPIIIKPCECSGSRGSRKIEQYNEKIIEEVFTDCKSYSRNRMVAVEEYVEMPSLTTIEGDIFLYEGEILWDGLFYTTRAAWAPMVPMTYTAPLFLEKEKFDKLKDTLSKLFKAAGVQFGEYNIEGYFNKKGDFFVIEINVRQGGHEIPLLVNDFSGIDLCKLLVSTAVRDTDYWEYVKNYERHYRYAIKQTTFSQEAGKYAGLYIDESIKQYVTRTLEYLKEGDAVEKCVDGTSLVAIVDLIFPTFDEQLACYERINDLIRIKVK